MAGDNPSFTRQVAILPGEWPEDLALDDAPVLVLELAPSFNFYKMASTTGTVTPAIRSYN